MLNFISFNSGFNKSSNLVKEPKQMPETEIAGSLASNKPTSPFSTSVESTASIASSSSSSSFCAIA